MRTDGGPTSLAALFCFLLVAGNGAGAVVLFLYGGLFLHRPDEPVYFSAMACFMVLALVFFGVRGVLSTSSFNVLYSLANRYWLFIIFVVARDSALLYEIMTQRDESAVVCESARKSPSSQFALPANLLYSMFGDCVAATKIFIIVTFAFLGPEFLLHVALMVSAKSILRARRELEKRITQSLENSSVTQAPTSWVNHLKENGHRKDKSRSEGLRAALSPYAAAREPVVVHTREYSCDPSASIVGPSTRPVGKESRRAPLYRFAAFDNNESTKTPPAKSNGVGYPQLGYLRTPYENAGLSMSPVVSSENPYYYGGRSGPVGYGRSKYGDQSQAAMNGYLEVCLQQKRRPNQCPFSSSGWGEPQLQTPTDLHIDNDTWERLRGSLVTPTGFFVANPDAIKNSSSSVFSTIAPWEGPTVYSQKGSAKFKK